MAQPKAEYLFWQPLLFAGMDSTENGAIPISSDDQIESF